MGRREYYFSDQLFDYIYILRVGCHVQIVMLYVLFIQGFERDGQLNFSGEVVACHAC